jgi:hypothetical protein
MSYRVGPRTGPLSCGYCWSMYYKSQPFTRSWPKITLHIVHPYITEWNSTFCYIQSSQGSIESIHQYFGKGRSGGNALYCALADCHWDHCHGVRPSQEIPTVSREKRNPRCHEGKSISFITMSNHQSEAELQRFCYPTWPNYPNHWTHTRFAADGHGSWNRRIRIPIWTFPTHQGRYFLSGDFSEVRTRTNKLCDSIDRSIDMSRDCHTNLIAIFRSFFFLPNQWSRLRTRRIASRRINTRWRQQTDLDISHDNFNLTTPGSLRERD